MFFEGHFSNREKCPALFCHDRSLQLIHFFTDSGGNICYILCVDIYPIFDICDQLISYDRFRIFLKIIDAF